MSGRDPDKGKPIPHFTTDEEAEHFLDTADLSEYDLSGFVPMRFELRRKDDAAKEQVTAPKTKRGR